MEGPQQLPGGTEAGRCALPRRAQLAPVVRCLEPAPRCIAAHSLRGPPPPPGACSSPTATKRLQRTRSQATCWSLTAAWCPWRWCPRRAPTWWLAWWTRVSQPAGAAGCASSLPSCIAPACLQACCLLGRAPRLALCCSSACGGLACLLAPALHGFEPCPRQPCRHPAAPGAGLILSRANLVFRRGGRTVRARNAHLPVISTKVCKGAGSGCPVLHAGLYAVEPRLARDTCSGTCRAVRHNCLVCPCPACSWPSAAPP